MSEQAIFRRLRQVDQLRDLCLSLMKAKILTDADAVELKTKAREKRQGEKASLKNPADDSKP